MISADAADLAADWGPVPVRGKSAWLRVQLIEAIHTGRLAPGTSLPGGRELARALGVARGTADTVYAQLLDEGFIDLRARRRPVVAGPRGPGPPTPAPPSSAAPPPTPGVPDAALFPHRAWAAATRGALARLSRADLGYPDPSGHPDLRASIAGWLRRTRGVSTTPDDVHVTAGVAHALSLLPSVLSAGAWTIEQPGSDGSVHHLLARRLDVRPVSVDNAGLVPGNVPPDTDAVLVTPSHQYPTGTLMPPRRRRELVDVCRRTEQWIVEDDYDSHLAAPGVVPSAMQALAPDAVILTGSLSKLLAPGLRLGWIVAPPAVAERLRELREQSDLGVSVILQLTVAELIDSGQLDRHLRRARTVYGRRRAQLAAALAPRWSLRGAPVGVHAFARCSDAAEAARLVGEARVPAVAVAGDHWNGAVLSVAAVPA